jgi:hypothetical protein
MVFGHRFPESTLRGFLIRHVGSYTSTRGILEAILNLEQGVGFEPLTKDSRSSPLTSYHTMATLLPVVPSMVKEGRTFPSLPCDHHVPTVESMFGAGCHHHFLGDGHTCVQCKSLALLLLARVDGKWKVRIDSLVEIGDVIVKIRLADLRVCSANVGDKLS